MLKSLLSALRKKWFESPFTDIWAKSIVVLMVLNLVMTIAFFLCFAVASMVYGPIDLSFHRR